MALPMWCPRWCGAPAPTLLVATCVGRDVQHACGSKDHGWLECKTSKIFSPVIKAAAVPGVLACFKYLLLVASLSRDKPCGVEKLDLPCLGPWTVSLAGVWSSPVGSGEEGRQWHCIRAERGWAGFILPLEHHPQRNSFPGLCHLPQQGKTDEKQWSTQLHNEKQ